MTSDWIKMRTDLYRDPKVCVVADLLMDYESALSHFVNQNMQRNMTVTRNVTRNATVGALVSVWGVLRHRGKRDGDDLVVKGCTLAVVDDIADLPGFGDALAEVGWLCETDEGLILKRFFEEFNVDPSDELRNKNAERQRRFREKGRNESNVTRNVTVALESNDREEKRREEIKPIAPPALRIASSKPQPASRDEDRKAWIESKAKRCGLSARPGEEWTDYASRVKQHRETTQEAP